MEERIVQEVILQGNPGMGLDFPRIGFSPPFLYLMRFFGCVVTSDTWWKQAILPTVGLEISL